MTELVFDLMDDLCAEAARRLTDQLGTVLCASSGTDTCALTFTHPAFLRQRGLVGLPAVGLYVYLDRTSREVPTVEFDDGLTQIRVQRAESLRVSGIEGHLLTVEWQGLADSSHPEYGRRRVLVALLTTQNEAAASLFRTQQWVPDLFIGVCDGCRFGGNTQCVNQLTRHGVPRAQLSRVPVSRWWITDHFTDCREYPGELRNGDLVESNDADFPLRFRKVALLSSEWGRYRNSGHPPLRGATLFEVELVPQTDAA
ncbi:MAG: hypothetical protein U0R69_13455 [Gaiellales bacterium]